MFLPQFAKLHKILGPQGALAKFQVVQNSRGKQCMQSEPYINSGMKLVPLRKNELMKLLQINLGNVGVQIFLHVLGFGDQTGLGILFFSSFQYPYKSRLKILDHSSDFISYVPNDWLID